MSALATITGSLGELTESELQQLYLMVGVRLGIPGVLPGSKSQGKGGGKSTVRLKPTAGKPGKKVGSSKGNPARKSQWANHPLYQEYSRLKKAVETQAKEAKRSFNDVDTAESRAYRQAFNLWLEAKSSFRDHGESGQNEAMPRKKEADSESESGEEEGPLPIHREKLPVAPAKPGGVGGKSTSNSPPKGKAATK